MNMDVSSWSEALNRTASVDEPRIDLPHLTLQTGIGISVAIAGNVLISLALNLQKLAHLRLSRERRQARMERELHSVDRLRSRSLQDQAPSEDPASSDEPETQPLIPDSSASGPRARYGASAEAETRRDNSRSRKSTSLTRGRRVSKPQRKPSFASRFLPFRISLHDGVNDDREDVSHTQEASAIPVDVIPAECLVALNGNHMRRYPAEDLEDEGTESDYLRSKLWSVFLFWKLNPCYR